MARGWLAGMNLWCCLLFACVCVCRYTAAERLYYGEGLTEGEADAQQRVQTMEREFTAHPDGRYTTQSEAHTLTHVCHMGLSVCVCVLVV